jgi:hypothetical protein
MPPAYLISNDASDRQIATQILGAQAIPEPIASTKNEVSAWSSGLRSVVIKRWPTGSVSRAALEAMVYRRIEPLGIAPALLGEGTSVIVLERHGGHAVIDDISPTFAVERLPIFVSFVLVMAAFHDACTDLAAVPVAPVFPGPYGFCHGDALPHNLLINSLKQVVLFDFDQAGQGPLLLDLVGMLCVLPTHHAIDLYHTYAHVRGWKSQDTEPVFREVLAQYPSLRLERLRGQQAIFRGDTFRFNRMLAWFEAAVKQQSSNHPADH